MKILHIAAVSFIEDNNHVKATGLSNSVPKLAKAQTKNNDVGIVTTQKSNNPFAGKLYWKSVFDKSFIDLLRNDPFQIINKEFGRPDILHTHDIYEFKALPFIYHALKNNIRVYISPRGTLSPVALSRNKIKKIIYINFLFNFFIKNITGFVALNQQEQKIIGNRYKNMKVITISNGCDNNEYYFEKYKKNYISKQKDKIINIGYLGRYEVYIKGLDLLINAFANYQSQTERVKIKLTLIGEHSTKTDSQGFFSDVEKKLKDKSMLIMKGPLYNEEKFDELSKFDIFIHPSRSEGMPNAVLEAISMGIPCLVTPQTNMGKIIENADCGWIIDPCIDHIKDFFFSIENMSKKELYEKGQNGIKYAKNYLEWERVAIREFYE